MTNRRWIGGMVGLAVVTIFYFAGEAEVAGEDAGMDDGTFKPVASVHSLMEGQEHHFAEIKELLLDEGAKDRAKRLETEAEILAELANVNRFHKSKSDYQGWAVTLRNDAMKFAQAAKDSDNERMRALYKTINTTCNDCHDKYQ